jgi:hypothetical protein
VALLLDPAQCSCCLPRPGGGRSTQRTRPKAVPVLTRHNLVRLDLRGSTSQVQSALQSRPSGRPPTRKQLGLEPRYLNPQWRAAAAGGEEADAVAGDESVMRQFTLAVALLLDPAAILVLLAASAGATPDP